MTSSRSSPGPFNNFDEIPMGFIGGIFPQYPEGKRHLLSELESRIMRLAGTPGSSTDDYVDIGDNYVVWWLRHEIGLARKPDNPVTQRYDPILILQLGARERDNPIEWGSIEEIEAAMEQLRRFMVLDDMIQD